jgi:hypothetical protein
MTYETLCELTRFFANAGALLRALAHDLFGYHHA